MSRGARRKAKARAERSRRVVSILVLLAIWMGILVMLVMPARNEYEDARIVAETAEETLERVVEEVAEEPGVQVEAEQISNLARALPDRFDAGVAEDTLRRAASPPESSLDNFNVSSEVEQVGDVHYRNIEASISGTSEGVIQFVRSLEMNPSVEGPARIVSVNHGTILTIEEASIEISGNNARSTLVLRAYSLEP